MTSSPWYWLSQNPEHLRVAATALLLGVVIAAERLWPRRPVLRRSRWLTNLALLIAAGAMLSLIPLAAVGVAAWAGLHHLGLFNLLAMPRWIEIPLSVIALDAAMYWQHRSMHGPAWLWRLHRVHHSDVEFDATTALRFHPFELLASSVWKWAAVLLLGASPAAVLVFEAATGIYSLFIHSNVRLPSRLDAIWRRVFVTPDLHRVHHSVDFDEGNRNFGTILSCWDHWFASHCVQPAAGHEAMQIGVAEFRDPHSQTVLALLKQPWRGEPPARSNTPDGVR
jgi:sterol desaturase/sphingolipid hydroxylase (fatty acid hydroxylase superfamily)